MLAALNVVALILTLSLAAASLQGEHIGSWRPLDYVRSVATSSVASIGGSVLLTVSDVPWRELPVGARSQKARGVLLGVLVAAPLLIVFAGLFASADRVFGNVLANVLAFDIESVASHMFLFTLWAALVAGYLRWGLLGRPFMPAVPARLSVGIVPVATALVLINALFLLFVVIQLRYFFGGTALVEGTTGLTYATYAREGFFQLVTASGLVLPLLLGANYAVRDAQPGGTAVFRRLATLLLVLLAVIMASALQRMRLYVSAFGLSEDRLYATAFMVLLVGIFAWFAWTVLRHRPRRFAFGVLMQGFAVLAGLHILNPGAFIVRTNLNRPAAERPFDAEYAITLGADAVPNLIAALPHLRPSDQCVVAQGLLRRWHDDETQRGDWRTWNWSRSRARRLIAEREEQLRALACSDAPKV